MLNGFVVALKHPEEVVLVVATRKAGQSVCKQRIRWLVERLLTNEPGMVLGYVWESLGFVIATRTQGEKLTTLITDNGRQ